MISVPAEAVRRIARQSRPHCAGGPVVSSKKCALGGEANEGDRRSREWFQRFWAASAQRRDWEEETNRS